MRCSLQAEVQQCEREKNIFKTKLAFSGFQHVVQKLGDGELALKHDVDNYFNLPTNPFKIFEFHMSPDVYLLVYTFWDVRNIKDSFINKQIFRGYVSRGPHMYDY